MGCRNSKPADGMKPGTEPTEIWADNIWHQEGVDGQTYLILKDSLGCHTYCALTLSTEDPPWTENRYLGTDFR